MKTQSESQLLRVVAAGSSLLALMLASSAARADDDDPPPPPAPIPAPPPPYGEVAPAPRAVPPPYVPEYAPAAPPLGTTGFQMALRSGVAIPTGSIKDPDIEERGQPGSDRTALNEVVGLQIPITVDIGGKPNKHLFIGGYFGFGVGKVTTDLGRGCNDLKFDCNSTNVRLGAQIHYAIAPNDWVNPWVGYGIGYSWLTAGDDGYKVSLRGWDFAHFLLGVDFRISRTVGIGPYVDFSVGKYDYRGIEEPTGAAGSSGDINGLAFHHWFMVGPRVVLMP